MTGYTKEVMYLTTQKGLLFLRASFAYNIMLSFSVLGNSQQGLQEFVIFPYLFR